jgi:hypothetical protein
MNMGEPEYKKIAHELWELLDDIDTYGDMFKPEQTHYFKKVDKKAAERFKYAYSDGYSLFFKDQAGNSDMPEDDSEPATPFNK